MQEMSSMETCLPTCACGSPSSNKLVQKLPESQETCSSVAWLWAVSAKNDLILVECLFMIFVQNTLL